MNDNKMYKVSVVVLMYNPIPEKLWLTLNSIINQEKVDLEIVIGDDGSENNLFDAIEEYMKKNHPDTKEWGCEMDISSERDENGNWNETWKISVYAINKGIEFTDME